MHTPPTQPSGAPDLDKQKSLYEFSLQQQTDMNGMQLECVRKQVKINELQAEVKELTRITNQLSDINDQLQAQLAQHPDTKRLDWLEKHRQAGAYFDYVTIQPIQKWENIRSAIDEAMRKARKI